MDWSTAKARFAFLSEALDGTGGFAPRVTWQDETVVSSAADGTPLTATRRVPRIASPSHLVQHNRESAEKYAGRCAVAVYENHLRHACERFASYLARRRPLRDGADTPLAALLVANADLMGHSLDEFMSALALHLRARGTMLVLMDRPESMSGATKTLLEQTSRRAVPYLRMLVPEIVESMDTDPATGDVRRITIRVRETINGELRDAQRTWDDETWSLHDGDKVYASGQHGFGHCPVLAVTENGAPPPVVGRYAQVADLSRRLYNARSERDDILRSQTFSVLTLQQPQGATRTPAEVAATIGTHSLLVHEGITPAFVSPDSGPAETYRLVIEELQSSIRRLTFEDATDATAQPESGLSRRLRFEALNVELASVATRLQGLERRVWALFHRALGLSNKVSVEYPTDFNLVDTLAELDILTAMQAAGFPDAALVLKRKTIAAAEFDAADEDDKAAVMAALDESAQARAKGGDDTDDDAGDEEQASAAAT